MLDSALNRRITADTLIIADGPALQGVSNVGGTLGNCSGAHTPWNTVLTCEENYQDYVPEDLVTNGVGTVGGLFQKNGTHFGWVVEIDPHDPNSVPVKHTWLGRFRHENVALRTAANAPVIAYMGDDRTNGHVYKFVSAARYVPGSRREQGTAGRRPAVLGAVQRRRHGPMDRAGAGHRAQSLSRIAGARPCPPARRRSAASTARRATS